MTAVNDSDPFRGLCVGREQPVTGVDRPDNGQDELVWVQLPADDVAFLRGFDPDRDRTASRADMVRVVEHLQDAIASRRAGAGEQQREQVVELVAGHRPVSPYWCRCGWQARGDLSDRSHAGHVADELLALLGGPQPDDPDPQCPSTSHGTDGGWRCAVDGPHSDPDHRQETPAP